MLHTENRSACDSPRDETIEQIFDTRAILSTSHRQILIENSEKMSRFLSTTLRNLCGRLRCTNAPMRLHSTSAKRGIQKAIFGSRRDGDALYGVCAKRAAIT